ncbi:DUF2312 domain-containing protein [Pseudorhodoplanes sp.]|uniref:DUF2312 domain-containing protein n=1 Tax=Pseudorhodoplanes sp. TaxID=1934341 RepID=UPI00391C9D9F
MNANANGGGAADLLADFAANIEELEVEKRRIADRIKEVKASARSAGFDTKVLNQMLRERRMSQLERQEFQALCEMYRAALGMLGGTPLGEAARKRLMGEIPRPPDPADASTPAAPEAVDRTMDIEAARAAGRAAAREGKRIIDNPYMADDPRRAAWDEGWCAETGTDGMEVPEAWRRCKKSDDNPPDGGDDDGGGQ